MPHRPRNQIPDPPDGQLSEEAAEWFLRMSGRDCEADDVYPSAAERNGAFHHWYTRSPRHLQAFLDICELDFRSLTLDAQHRIDIERMLTRHTADVIALPNAPPSQRRQRSKSWPAAVAAAMGALASVIVAYWILAGPLVYSTAIGEQRVVRLDDGSVVYLNTDTRMAVAYSRTQRSIRLIRGEALFSVEHDPTRPFVVTAESARVRAVGTRFDIRDRANSVDVAVIEGVVQVTAATDRVPPASPLPKVAALTAARVAAGELARITAGHVFTAVHPTVADTVSWLQRRLIFRNATLGEVAAEFNRYNRRRIKIVGDTARQRIFKAAIFDADRPQSLILYISKDSSLVVQPEGDDWVVRSRPTN